MSQVTIKLRQTGLDDDEIVALATDPAALELHAADRAVVDYAAKLTARTRRR